MPLRYSEIVDFLKSNDRLPGTLDSASIHGFSSPWNIPFYVAGSVHFQDLKVRPCGGYAVTFMGSAVPYSLGIFFLDSDVIIFNVSGYHPNSGVKLTSEVFHPAQLPGCSFIGWGSEILSEDQESSRLHLSLGKTVVEYVYMMLNSAYPDEQTNSDLLDALLGSH